MEQPSGYITQGENTVCRLRKVIYGLKQNPRAWFEKFSMVISSIDLLVIQITQYLFVVLSLLSDIGCVY